MTHVWYWRARPMCVALPRVGPRDRLVDGGRKGEPCRVLARGALNSVLVEFADGYRVVASRFAVRRGDQQGGNGG